MKIIFLVSITLLLVITPVYGQLLSDSTGLVNRLDVQIGEHIFEVETVANFDISNFEFSEDEKKLTLYISSGLENNLGEVVIPHDLLGGNLTFYLNDQEYFPEINSNKKISFVTLNFTGSGDNELEIFGTNLFDTTEKNEMKQKYSSPLQPGEVFDDSLIWIVLIMSLIIVAIFVTMKIKKRN